MRALQFGAFLSGCAAVFLLAMEGRPELATLLCLALFCCLPRLIGQPAVGQVLRWRDGCWSLNRGAGYEPIVPAPGCRVTPWVVLFCWRNATGERGSLWIPPDAVPCDQWRRLRVRLHLEG